MAHEKEAMTSSFLMACSQSIRSLSVRWLTGGGLGRSSVVDRDWVRDAGY